MKSKKTRSKEIGTPVLVRLQSDDLQQLDGWIKSQDGLLSRPEAIRRLINEALVLHKK